MRRQRQLLSALIILAFSFTGCLKSNPVSLGGGDFTVNISSGTTPECSPIKAFGDKSFIGNPFIFCAWIPA